MIDFLDSLDNELNDNGARVVPIITEIHEVANNTDIKDSKADDIPILPLRNMVLFPSMTMPVSVGREKSMRLIKEAEESHCSIAVVCQYDSHVDDPVERDLYRYGTIGTIIKVLELPDEVLEPPSRGATTARRRCWKARTAPGSLPAA